MATASVAGVARTWRQPWEVERTCGQFAVLLSRSSEVLKCLPAASAKPKMGFATLSPLALRTLVRLVEGPCPAGRMRR